MTFPTNTPRRARSICLALVWALLWAGAFVAVSRALDDAGAAMVVALRCGIAAIIMLAFTFGHVRRYTVGQLGAVAAVGIVNNAGYLGIIAAALPHLSAGFAAILSSLTPLAVLTLTAATSRHFPAVPMLGVALGLSGIVASAWGRVHTGQVDTRGLALGLGAVFCLVAATWLTPRLIPDGNPYFLTGWQALAAAIPLAVIAALSSPHVRITPVFVICLAYLVLAATVVGMTMWLALIRDVGAQRASVAHFLPPLFGLGLGAALLGETVTTIELLAAVPVAAGIVLATRTPHASAERSRTAANQSASGGHGARHNRHPAGARGQPVR